MKIENGVLNGVTNEDIINGTFTFPDGVTSISAQAFKDCENLEKIVIPSGVTFIGESAFAGCKSLKSVLMPTSVAYIEANAFEGCSSLESVNIPWNICRIGNGAFKDCKNLTDVQCPEFFNKYFISIASNTFEGCDQLQDFDLPSEAKLVAHHLRDNKQVTLSTESLKGTGEVLSKDDTALADDEGLSEIGNKQKSYLKEAASSKSLLDRCTAGLIKDMAEAAREDLLEMEENGSSGPEYYSITSPGLIGYLTKKSKKLDNPSVKESSLSEQTSNANTEQASKTNTKQLKYQYPSLNRSKRLASVPTQKNAALSVNQSSKSEKNTGNPGQDRGEMAEAKFGSILKEAAMNELSTDIQFGE